MANGILDFGNQDFKVYDGDSNFIHMLHAVVEINQSSWLQSLNRNGNPKEGYLAVQGRYFVIGDAAKRMILGKRPEGSARYTQWYYGVGALYALSELFSPYVHNVNFYGLHAPRDIRYAEDIENAIYAFDNTSFITHKGEFRFNFTDVGTLDEPLGGLGNYLLTKEGHVLKSSNKTKDTILTIDVGSLTTDWVVVDRDAKIDESTLDSSSLGVRQVFAQFQTDLKDAYADDFKRYSGDLPVRKVEEAIQQGTYKFGKKQLKCKGIAKEALATLANDVISIVYSMGGEAEYDIVLVTGGGGALIYDELCKAIPNIEFVLAEKNRKNMRYANVFGAAKFQKLVLGAE